MSTPTSSLSSLRPDLERGLEEFNLAMDRQGFIGHRILPVFQTGEKSGTFGKVTLESLLQTRATERAPGSGYARGNWQFETETFATAEHGAEEPVDDNDRRAYAKWVNVDQIATQRAFDAVLRNAEIRAAAAIYNTTTWTGAALTTAITHEWDDASNAVPITDVNAAKQKVWDGTGMYPNALVINRKVFNNLRNCTSVKSAISASGAGYATRQRDISVEMLKAVFDLDYILVAGSAKNTAKEGQSASISSIWSDEYAMVCKICTTGDLQEPGLGRTFNWAGDGGRAEGLVEEYREEQTRSKIIRVRHQVQEKILYAACGHLLSNVTT